MIYLGVIAPKQYMNCRCGPESGLEKGEGR